MNQTDCQIVKGKILERIRIIENEKENNLENLPNTIQITLQTQEGRKSRVKFQIARVCFIYLIF